MTRIYIFLCTLPPQLHLGKLAYFIVIVHYFFEKQNFKNSCCEDRPVTLKMKSRPIYIF